MHILTVGTDQDLGLQGKLAAGRYLIEDVAGAQLMAVMWDTAMDQCANQFPFDPQKDWSKANILVVRPGGFGDLLFLTPCLREIKNRWPGVHLDVGTFQEFAPIFNGLDLCGTIPYPIPLKMAQQYDAWIFLENSIENNPAAKDHHMTDMFAKRIGIELASKQAEYKMSDEERNWAEVTYPRNKDKPKRIAVQAAASIPTRAYPSSLLTETILQLEPAGWEIFILGRPGEINSAGLPFLRNLCNDHLNFRQSIAVLSTCDIVLGPDSAIIHYAGALGIPALGLYGPFSWKVRTCYAPKTYCLQGKGECGPCFHHPRGNASPFPQNGPCTVTGRCELLAQLQPRQIVKKLEEMVAK
jgi:ADP-heptose:LPS heptosyltransferase